MEGEAKLVIISSNCMGGTHNALKETGVHIFEYAKQGMELGLACGKPFIVASLAIEDPGESEILSLKHIN